MKQSLQAIEDFYVAKGLRGAELRKAVEADGEYQQLKIDRQHHLTADWQIASEEETARYILSTDQDYEILEKIHQLEKRTLSDHDREIVALIRTQLEDDWRTPLIEKLDELLGKS